MILKGRSRADGGKLATYLLSTKNEQVRVLDIRGTVSDEPSPQGLKASLKDMDEIGKMTKAKSTLFHLAINPHDSDTLTRDQWRHSVDKAEQALGLQGQPRAIVSHTYDGKEHYHVVWSRVDVETRTCAQMSFSNLKLCKAAREIELELGLKQIPGKASRTDRVKQRTRDIEGQQDKRASQPREGRRADIRSAWDNSSNGQEFKEQIEKAGYILAAGRRGVVVMDSDKVPHSIPRYVEGIKLKHVHEKMSDLDWRALPDADALRKPMTRSTETGDSRAQTPARRNAQHITERGAREAGLKPTLDAPEPTPRKAQNITREQAGQELTASNDNAVSPDKLVREYTRFKGENDAQFAARVARLEARAEREAQKEKEEPKLEMHLRPKGATFGR